MSATLDWAAAAARHFEPKQLRFATPGELARHCEATTRQTPALDLIDQAVVAVVDGSVRKQQIYAPPQVGKSQRVSRWLPLWALLFDPTMRIAIVSAETELARRWGRQIRRDLRSNPDLGLELQADSQAAGRWETVNGGELFCTSYAAGTTGRPIDLLIIDDPFKDRASAESETIRERVWEFWENDGGVRARRTILMNTRWHADDLSGRLLKREPGQWSVLSMPAIAEAADDPLDREVGQEIQSANPDLHPPGYYAAKQQTTSSYVWASLYQQRPTAAQGNLFKRGDWRYWEALGDGQMFIEGQTYALADCYRFITMDLATSTRTSADYTVAAAWAITGDGLLVLLDRVRERVPQVDHFALVAPLRSRWLGRFDVTYIESRMFGSDLVYALGKKGLPIAELDADADKVTRALSAADLQRQHRIILPQNLNDLDGWIDEHAVFGPKAAHDDQVDVTAYAARVAHTRWLPMESAAEEAVRQTTPDPDDVDLLTAAW